MAQENVYPNGFNYPRPTFLTPIPIPLVDPDEGDVILVAYSLEWQKFLLGCVTQGFLPSTWEGTDEEKTHALNMVANLQYLLTVEAGEAGVPTPYWDDASDLDDQEPVGEQQWYGIFDGTFQETVENFVIAGFIAYSGQIGAAITFLTLAPRFRLAWKTADLGGIIRVIIDGADAGAVDTQGDDNGIIERDYVGDPDVENHSILMYLESVP